MRFLYDVERRRELEAVVSGILEKEDASRARLWDKLSRNQVYILFSVVSYCELLYIVFWPIQLNGFRY